MKIIHGTSGQVIDVPDDHALMLKGQGWMDYAEIKNEAKLPDTKSAETKEAQRPEAKVLIQKKRGRPPNKG